MHTINGQIAFLNTKPWGNKTLYSVKLANNDKLFLCGEKRPPANKGDFVSFNYKENAKGQLQADSESFRIDTSKTETVTSAPRMREAFPAAYDKRQETIEYQAARNSAIAAVGVLVESSAIKLRDQMQGGAYYESDQWPGQEGWL